MVVTWWKGESWCPKTVHKKIKAATKIIRKRLGFTLENRKRISHSVTFRSAYVDFLLSAPHNNGMRYCRKATTREFDTEKRKQKSFHEK